MNFKEKMKLLKIQFGFQSKIYFLCAFTYFLHIESDSPSSLALFFSLLYRIGDHLILLILLFWFDRRVLFGHVNFFVVVQNFQVHSVFLFQLRVDLVNDPPLDFVFDSIQAHNFPAYQVPCLFFGLNGAFDHLNFTFLQFFAIQ